MNHRKHRDERGQILLMTTLSLMALIGLLALVVDIGWAYFQRKSAQKAADSASLAGAYQALFNVRGRSTAVRQQRSVPGSDALPGQPYRAELGSDRGSLSLRAAERFFVRWQQWPAECDCFRGHDASSADSARRDWNLLLDDSARDADGLYLVWRGNDLGRQ